MLLLFFLPLFLLASQLSIKTDAPCVCVINQDTGKVIYGKNINRKIFPASTSKIAIALYLIEECELDEGRVINCISEPLRVSTEKKKVASNYTLPPYILESDGVSIHLQAGEKITLGDLLRATVIRSSNDAANVLAQMYGADIPGFMFEVNKFCRKIGCKNTHFVNPHGLHHPDHYTTAYDLSIIMKRASSHPLFRELISTLRYDIPKTNRSPSRHLKNSNYLINPKSKYFVSSVVGGKTGYHRRAKYNIAALAEENNRSVIAVVNSAESSAQRFDACQKIFSAAFSEKTTERLLFNCKDSKFLNTYSWGNKQLTAVLHEDSILTYYPSEEEEITVNVHWEEITSPIKKGDIVGSIDIYSESGIPLKQELLYAAFDVNHRLMFRLRQGINGCIRVMHDHPFISITCLLLFYIIFIRRRKQVIKT